jgi:hypothetical protein
VLARTGILAVVAIVIAVLGIVLIGSRSTTSGSGTTTPVGSARRVFTQVPGHYDAALRRTFPGQSFQVTFGARPSSAPSADSYRIPAARDATGLLRATTQNGDVVALNLIPAPNAFQIRNSDTGFRSTAVALVAMSPGLLTADPYADMALLREISQLPEIDELAAQLQRAAKVDGSAYLNRARPATESTIAIAVRDLETSLTSDALSIQSDPGIVTTPPVGSIPQPTPGPSSGGSPQPSASWAAPSFESVAPPNHPPSCDGAGLAPVGGFEGDEICLTALQDLTPPDVATEEVSVRAVNLAPRWAIVTRPNGNALLPSGLITPKTWSVPGLSDLLQAVADAVANSSDASAFKGAAAWLDNIIGVNYHPYYGGDDFLTALSLSVRRFASDSVSNLTLTPDTTRQIETLTLGRQWADDPGGPPSSSGWQTILPSLLTVYDGVIKPIVLVVMDIKSATQEANDAVAAAEQKQQMQAAIKSGATGKPGSFCKASASGQPAVSTANAKDLLICRKDEDGRLRWLHSLNGAAVGDAEAANNEDCLQHYIDLAAALAPKLADVSNAVGSSGGSDLLSSLEGVLGAVVDHPRALGCLMSHALFTAAKDGTLGAAAQHAAGVLAENNVETIDALVTLIQHGEGLGNLAAQAVSGLLSSIVSSVTETVITKVTEKIALAIAPGGDLLAAVNIAQKAGDITGLVLGLVDLINAEVSYSDGSVYAFGSADAIRTAAAMYPHVVGPDTGIAVPYTPTYWGDADWVVDAGQTGFWVSGPGQLDVFHADGTPDYTIRASDVAGRLVLVKNTPGGVSPAWTTSVGQSGFGAVGIVADEKTGNVLTYMAGLILSDMKIFNGQTGSLITDVDAQFHKAGYNAGISSGWVTFDNGSFLATGLDGSAGNGGWLTSFSGGGGSVVGTAGSPETVWSDGTVGYAVFDDRTVWRESGSSLAKVLSLSATPASEPTGIDDPTCGGTYSYVTDDGFVARDFQNGSNAWEIHVDPKQGTGPGNRALVSVVDPKSCDVLAADDHGVITRYSGTGNPPRTVWTTQYGYLVQGGSTDAPYPVSDLQLTVTAVLAVSNYDPHLAAFSLADGTRLYSYPLGSETIALPRLKNGELLAIGKDGELTLLRV